MVAESETAVGGWSAWLPPFIRVRLGARRPFRKVLVNVAWLFLDRALRLGVGLLVGARIARYLGPDQYGLLNYSAALVAILLPLATLGLDNIIIHDIVERSADTRETLGTAFVVKAAGGFLSMGIVFGAAVVLRPGEPLTRWLVAALAIGTVFRAFDTVDFWFQSQVQSKFVVWARYLAFLLLTLVRLVLLRMGAPLLAFAIATSVETIVAALAMVAVYQLRGGNARQWRVRWGRLRQLLQAGWPLMLSSMAIMVYMKIDQILLGNLVGNHAVGIYAAAARLSELWYFIPTAITSSVFPVVIAAKAISPSVYYRRLQLLFDVMSGLGLAIALPMTFLAGPVVGLLYRERYAGAGMILSLHIWAAIFVFLGSAQSPWDVAEGYTKLALRRTLIGAFVNVGMCLLLIPRYEGLGAAVATVVSYAAATLVGNALDPRTRPIFVMQVKSLLLYRHLRSVRAYLTR